MLTLGCCADFRLFFADYRLFRVDVVLCYAMLLYAICYSMLCCAVDAVLCYAMLFYAICYAVLCCAMDAVLCYAMLCYSCYAMVGEFRACGENWGLHYIYTASHPHVGCSVT